MRDLRQTLRVRILRIAAAVSIYAMLLLAGACGDASAPPGQVGTHTLTGDISIEGAFELSHIPPSQIVVQLEDVSLQDASSVVIAEQVYEEIATLPLTYELTWTGDLDPERHYAVAASVYDESGDLIFWTDTVFPVRPGDDHVDFTIISVFVR